MTTSNSGAPTAAPKNHITQEVFDALLGELYERLGLAEGRVDDLERTRNGQDRVISALRERIATLERAD